MSDATASGHWQHGLQLALDGRYEEAVAEFQHALILEPGVVAGAFNLAVCYAHLGRRDEAFEQIRWMIDSGRLTAQHLTETLQLYYDLAENRFTASPSLVQELHGL